MQLDDIEKVVDYFVKADTEFLKGMGADKNKIPKRQDWIDKLRLEYNKPYDQKAFYYIIWLINDEPVGHSNVDKIIFGDIATMHLHMWKSDKRKSGLGIAFLRLSIPYYFNDLALKKIICEPYAKNIAPNKTVKKLGFQFIRTYTTIPGWLNFSQPVHRYELSRTQYEIYKTKEC